MAFDESYCQSAVVQASRSVVCVLFDPFYVSAVETVRYAVSFDSERPSDMTPPPARPGVLGVCGRTHEGQSGIGKSVVERTGGNGRQGVASEGGSDAHRQLFRAVGEFLPARLLLSSS